MEHSKDRLQRLEDFALAFDRELSELKKDWDDKLQQKIVAAATNVLATTREDIRTHAISARFELSRGFAATEEQLKTDVRQGLTEIKKDWQDNLREKVVEEATILFAKMREDMLAHVTSARFELAKVCAATEERIRGDVSNGLKEAAETAESGAKQAAIVALEACRQFARVHAEDLPKVVRRELAATPIDIHARPADQPPAPSWAEVFRGVWQKDMPLKRGDIFAFRGSTYLVLLPSMGVLPTLQTRSGNNPTYAVIAACGAPGPKGLDGTGSGGGGGTWGSITGTLSDQTDLQSALTAKVAQVAVPASSSASGTAGQQAYDASYLYQCVATNTWRRTPLADWS